jgi:DNA topoisomerase-3
MKLIIAEKPSVAKDIANAIGRPVQKEGYLESGGHVITYAFGHLITIDDEIAPKKWELNTLPILPNFKYKVIPDKYKQFKIIKELTQKASEVVIATDAGREGELIARLILMLSGYKGSLKRFWTSEALTAEVVKREMQKLKDGKTFDSLFQSALARQHSDWLVGINLSRAVSIKAGSYGKAWTVGRVQTPVLRLVVDRDAERENFKPEEYYLIKATFKKNDKTDKTYDGYLFNPKKEQQSDKEGKETEEDTKESGSRFLKGDIANILSILNNEKSGVIQDVRKENKKDLPPLLHSLTTLQREANTIYGLSAQTTLDIAQKLYETHKACSYPRTEAQHLGDDAVGLASSVIKKLGRNDLSAKVGLVGKRVFDSKKLTDHHAIIPLDKLPDSANDLEKKVYGLVYRKFIGAFMDPYEYLVTTVITDVKNLLFKTTGNIDIKLGWKELYKGQQSKDEQSVSIPPLTKGEAVTKLKHESIQKFTQPPPPYTEASILAKMKKLNLGTPATRASCLENLKQREYITLSKKHLLSSPKGKELIKHLRSNKVSSPEMTAQWEDGLESIYTSQKGKQGYESFIKDIRSFVSDSVNDIKGMSIAKQAFVSEKAIKYASFLASKTGIPVPDNAKKDAQSLSEYIENTKKQIEVSGQSISLGPSEKMINYAEKIAKTVGKALPPNIRSNYQELSKWINKYKSNMPVSLSEKQIEILKKNGQESLISKPNEAKKWIDNYFNKRKGSDNKFRSNNNDWAKNSCKI